MKKPIQISIPTPCHENWNAMTPEAKGRFCASCQKTVIDFTKSSDREIIEAFNTTAKLCGRFSVSQLNRDIQPHPTKNTFWSSAGLAAISLFTLIPLTLNARTGIKTEQGEKHLYTLKSTFNGKPKTIKGIVKDNNGKTLQGVKIENITLNETTVSDTNGKFTINAEVGNEIRFIKEGHIYEAITVKKTSDYITVTMEVIEMIITAVGEPALTPAESIVNRVLYPIYNFFR